MDMSDQQYQQYVKALAKPSPLARDMIWAFCVGGGICAGGAGAVQPVPAAGAAQGGRGGLGVHYADFPGRAAHGAGAV